MTESSLQRFQENNQLSKQEARIKRKEIDQKIKETSASKVVRGLVGGGVTAVNEGVEVFDDNSGNKNFGISIGDFKPQFEKQTLRVQKSRVKNVFKTSRVNGAF